MTKPPKKISPPKNGKRPESRGFGSARGGKPASRAPKQGKEGTVSHHEGQKRDDTRRSEKRREEPRRTDSGKGSFRAAPSRQRESVQKTARLNADLFGFHAVREAWKNPARFVHALYITEAAMKEFEGDVKTTTKRPAPTIVTKDDLDKIFPVGTVHQGIALSCQPLAEISVIDIIIKAEANPKSVIVILDQVTDPHNIGAILRSACAFGADGIVMQNRHAPEMTGILAKTACGAVDHIPVAYETNLSRAIEKLKEHHYTVIGMDEHASKTFSELHSYERAVIVLGAEGSGMRRLIREHCDVLVTLPTKPPIASLNVSNAAAVALYALCA